MRASLNAVVLLVVMLSGCASRQQMDFDLPDHEAVYDRPIEEVWPLVKTFFTANRFSYKEAPPGDYVLETEWKEEFGGSKVSGYWHRYMVLGKRETPTKGKLWIIRITKALNKSLGPTGVEISWGVSRVLGGGTAPGASRGQVNSSSEPVTSPEDWADYMSLPKGGENSFIANQGQGTRDMVMEWRVFRFLEPELAKKENVPVAVKAVAKAPEAVEAPNAMAVECGLPIVGLAKQVKPGGVMMLGELHGTQEVPRFLAQAACQATVGGTPVTVGLELPVESQGRVAQFLVSQGTEDDWLKLMEAPFWRSPYPDGRSSEAMANMLEQLRQLRVRGLDVEAFMFDHPKLKGQTREEAMAATVLARVKHEPGRFFLVVSGNVHPRVAKGLPWDKQYQPMGLLLSKQVKSVVALDMAYDTGSAWVCAIEPDGRVNQLDCGVKQAKGKDNGDRFFVHVWGGANANGYHGVFYVGPVSASAPAVMKGLGNPGSMDDSWMNEASEMGSLAAIP